MVWADGAHPRADNETDKWAAVKRWTSSHTGRIKVSGQIGRYFDTTILTGRNVEFSIAINANMPGDPTVYTKVIPADDSTVHSYFVDKIPVNAGDTVDFIIGALEDSAADSYMTMTAIVAETPDSALGDLNIDDTVNSADLSTFARQWCRIDCMSADWCAGADFDHNHSVNAADFALFALHWLENYPAK